MPQWGTVGLLDSGLIPKEHKHNGEITWGKRKVVFSQMFLQDFNLRVAYGISYLVHVCTATHQLQK